jgi:integrase/recombinase XerD
MANLLRGSQASTVLRLVRRRMLEDVLQHPHSAWGSAELDADRKGGDGRLRVLEQLFCPTHSMLISDLGSHTRTSWRDQWFLRKNYFFLKLPVSVQEAHHNVCYGVDGLSDLVFSTAYTGAPVPNRERHAGTIAAWQVAQTSRHTLTAYTRNLVDYCTWLDAMGFDLLSVRRVHIDGYRHTLVGAPSTIARNLAALSSFYKYAINDGMTVLNPVAAVTRPAIDADHSSTQGLTRDQARALLAVSRADDPRSHALVALLVFTGIRVGEALGARTTDYGHDAGHRTLTVRRKGGKSAKVAVPAPAAVALNEYLGTSGADLVHGHGFVHTAGQPLFTTSTGKPWQRSEAFRTVQRLARTAGIEGRISPHSLRHTFATIALDTGTSLHALQDSMGHADPRTTRRYDRARNNLTKSASYDVARALA